jgi:hypothetical protein
LEHHLRNIYTIATATVIDFEAHSVVQIVRIDHVAV